MKTKLTLQEKLRDLREERKLKLQDVADATGIPLAILGRMEANDDVRVGYQDLATLSKFYNVSTDYLFGVTDNRQHRNVEIDGLHLSDSAIEVMKGGSFNNRLLSEFLSHEDFPSLLNSMEVYIDRKQLPQMNVINALYKATEDTIRENFDVGENDEVMEFLQQSVVDEDEYLRYRISERFNGLVKSLFDEHKKDPLPMEQAEAMNEIREQLKIYTDEKAKTESEARGRMVLLAKQMGLNMNDLTREEQEILMKALEKSELYRKSKGKRRGGKRR